MNEIFFFREFDLLIGMTDLGVNKPCDICSLTRQKSDDIVRKPTAMPKRLLEIVTQARIRVRIAPIIRCDDFLDALR